MMTGISSFILIAFLAIGVGFFLWLRGREQKRETGGQSRLATWRLVVAAIFGLVALFSGGCSLLFVPSAAQGDVYVQPVAILIIGGIPFAVASFILWLCLRRGNG
jgi:hypothetical protein